MAFLPDIGSKIGYTHTEPTEYAPPCLFNSKRAATLALGAWLNRVARTEGYTVMEDGAVFDPVAHRRRDAMEIVVIGLTMLS